MQLTRLSGFEYALRRDIAEALCLPLSSVVVDYVRATCFNETQATFNLLSSENLA
jgi:hypothetical protein